MKKVAIIMMLILFSGCSMQASENSNQKLFYGENLIEIDGDEDNDISNTTFIYSPDKPNHYERFMKIR